MYSTGTVHSREVLKEVRATFGDKVFDIVICKSIRFPETSVASQSILDYVQKHKGAGAYRKLARELLAWIGEHVSEPAQCVIAASGNSAEPDARLRVSVQRRRRVVLEGGGAFIR